MSHHPPAPRSDRGRRRGPGDDPHQERKPMNLGDLTNLVEKPFAAMSNIVNTPNSAGRYRPFYLRNLLDAVQGRKLSDAVAGKTVLITGGSSGIGEAAAKKIAEVGGAVAL